MGARNIRSARTRLTVFQTRNNFGYLFGLIFRHAKIIQDHGVSKEMPSDGH